MEEIQVIEKDDMIVSIEEAKERYKKLQGFVKFVMKEGSDYGVVPGTDKPTLLKPGAEKLNNVYGLSSEISLIEKTEEWDKPFFNYMFKTILYDKRKGVKVAEGIGSCNSMESKYRFRWVFESELTADEEKELLKTKKFFSKKHNREYLMFRILNDDIFSQVNTIQKMAAKRSYVDATLKATRTSDFFTQDMEDLSDYQPVVKKDIKDKKVLLDSIATFRDTLGMEKEDLTLIVKEMFKTTDVSKLTTEQLTEIENMLMEKLNKGIEEAETIKQETLT